MFGAVENAILEDLYKYLKRNRCEAHFYLSNSYLTICHGNPFPVHYLIIDGRILRCTYYDHNKHYRHTSDLDLANPNYREITLAIMRLASVCHKRDRRNRIKKFFLFLCSKFWNILKILMPVK